jgi:uncharacterized membrane protein (UPF0127 family)
MAVVERSPKFLIATAAAVGALAALNGCDDQNPAAADVMPVKIAGKTFYLEVAAEGDVRTKGLGGRTHIEEDGGMIFAFTPAETRVQSFIMRDCPIPIDIIYLDGAGRVLTTYTMQPEPPRGPTEGQPGDFANPDYESRLKKYSSRFPCPFVVEVKDGTITRLGVKEGDLVKFDIPGLKKRTR